jgi:hypothetical protein
MDKFYNNITYNIGKVSRYIRDKNKNCFDNIFTLYNKTCDNISKGYNNEIIKENTYINEEDLKESLIKIKKSEKSENEDLRLI